MMYVIFTSHEKLNNNYIVAPSYFWFLVLILLNLIIIIIIILLSANQVHCNNDGRSTAGAVYNIRIGLVRSADKISSVIQPLIIARSAIVEEKN